MTESLTPVRNWLCGRWVEGVGQRKRDEGGREGGNGDREPNSCEDNDYACVHLWYHLGSATPTAATPTGSSLASRLSTQTGVEGALAYLLDCHERATQEERYSSKRGSGSERKAVLSLCKDCCITHSALLLQGYFGPANVTTKNR